MFDPPPQAVSTPAPHGADADRVHLQRQHLKPGRALRTPQPGGGLRYKCPELHGHSHGRIIVVRERAVAPIGLGLM